MEKNERITFRISTSSIVKVVGILVLCGVLFLIRDIVLVILLAVVIASAVEPLARWAESRKIPRVIAVISLYVPVTITFLSVFYFVLPSLITEISEVIKKLNDPSTSFFSEFEKVVSGNTRVSPSDATLAEISNTLSETLSNLSSGFIANTSRIFGGAFSFFIVVVLSFYLSVQKGGVEEFLRVIAPAKSQEYIVDLWRRTERKIGFWMQGQLLLGFVVGLMNFIGLSFLGIPHALILALLAGIFEIIPIFGPILSAIPGIIIAYSFGGVQLALFALILYVIVQQLENHVIYPLVVRKIVGISPIIVIISLLSGAKLAGVLGAILAVPIATSLMEYYGDVKKEKIDLA